MHLIPDGTWMKALGWSLISSLWQMAVLWLFYVIAAFFLRSNAAVRHRLATLLVAGGSIWFLVTLGDSYYSGFGDKGFLLNPGSRILPWIASIRALLITNLPIISFLYLGMLLFLGFRYIHVYRFSKQFKSAGIQKTPADLKLFVKSVCTLMGIRKEVTLRLSSMIRTPMTLGFWKPVVLLPVAMINNLSMQQVEAVLLHELAHIKRNDYLLNLFVAFIDVFFFFNPFSRLLTNTIRKEREHCCDDWVIQFRYDPVMYASALLSLEKNRGYGLQLAIAAVGRNQGLLLDRIRRINGQHRFRLSFSSRVMSLLLLVLLVCGLIWVKPSSPQAGVDRPAAYSTNANIPNREVEPVVYSIRESPAPVMDGANKKQAIRTIRITKKIDETPGLIVNTSYTPSNEPEYNTVASNAGAAIRPTEARDYSIAEPPPAPAADPSFPDNHKYPYVPNSSFSYQVTIDTTTIITREQLKTLEGMANTVNTAASSNLFVITPQAGSIVKLQKEMQKSMKALNWQQVNQDVITELPQRERKVVMDEINLQITNLKKAIRQNPLPNADLQKKLLGQQNRLQQLSSKQAEISRAKRSVVHI